jgi:ubiquinone/menaquinone biosynthesis C-methylase UbiE
MDLSGAAWRDREQREREQRPDTPIAQFNLKPGMFDGTLAQAVAPSGIVYASDIQVGMMRELRANASARGIRNIITVLGTESDPRLPLAKLHLILLVDVYHEFSHPQQMLDAMREVLKPNGRLVLIEFRKARPQCADSP